jgi:hypothetical protein
VIRILVIAVFVAVGGLALFSRGNAPSKPVQTAQKAAPKAPDPKEAEEEALFQRDVLNVRVLKRSLHNPDSFQLESAIRMPDGTLCLTFRATNVFNAIVLGQAVIRSDRIISTGHPEAVHSWNRYCAGKSGKNLIHIRRAL